MSARQTASSAERTFLPHGRSSCERQMVQPYLIFAVFQGRALYGVRVLDNISH